MAKDAQLKVKNWEQFQHYKDRNPPWIKLHFALLVSEDWVTLDDASKLLAVVCMLIASRNNGMVPNNPAYLKRVAYLNKLPNLKPLFDCGFLEIPQADASTLQAAASAPQADARPETETDKKDSLSETSSDKPSKKGKTGKVRNQYSPAFERFWSDYPRNLNMSKAEAFAEWQKIDEPDQAACHAAVPGYVAFLKSKPDLETIHACRFISKRRFEGIAGEAAASLVVSDDDWGKRLRYARHEGKWATSKWGPAPGRLDCRVPEHLLQPNDGASWREMENAA